MTDQKNMPCNSDDSNAQVYHISHAEVVAPNATTVVNNYTVVVQLSFNVWINEEFLERIALKK